MYQIRVTTINSRLEPSCGGFHEIHEANYLSSPGHAVETVRSIIKLNKLYSDTQLQRVKVETPSQVIMKALSNSDLDHSYGISVAYIWNPDIKY
jgi:K+/H+ antiporter YhaU regulatory subunit KhtT